MLKRIYCDKFGSAVPSKTIEFTSGLNIVLGGDEKTNSIGKSTFLFSIDFCFCGNTYANKGSDIIANVGHHEIYFDFLFNSKEYHFCRGTENPNMCWVCDSAKKKLGEPKKIEVLTDFLREKYFPKETVLSFRSLVTRFSRINGKGNYEVSKPLKSNGVYSGLSDEVKALEDLFGLLFPLANLKDEVSAIDEKLKSLRKAISSEWVNKGLSKKQYLAAKDEIQTIEVELADAVKRIDENAEDDDGLDPKALDLKAKINYLSRRKGNLFTRLSKIESLSNGQEMTIDDKEALHSFFPECALQSLSQIATFRQQLISNVNEEMEAEAVGIKIEIENIANELEALKEELSSMGLSPKASKAKIQECVEKSEKLKALRASIEQYEKKEALEASKKEKQEQLAKSESASLESIEQRLNNELETLNDGLYEIPRLAPTIKLESSKYVFSTPNDNGTGTMFKSLLVFDLAMLNLTPLPFVIHDSLLFSDIWTEPVKGLFDIYCRQPKQVFIAFDAVNFQQESVQEIVRRCKRISLGKDGLSLFGRSWALKQ